MPTTFAPPEHEIEVTTTFVLGAFIDLADLLAIPPDGNRYDRDDEGRLTLMAPDDFRFHGRPLTRLTRWLNRNLPQSYEVLQERAIAFARIYSLRGDRLRESFLGPKALSPDIAIFAGEPDILRGPHGLTFAHPRNVRIVLEVLSPGSWREALGVGSRDKVDRRRTYLESGVPEYWLVNPAVDDPLCPMKPRTLAAFTATGEPRIWVELDKADGMLSSAAVSELCLPIEELWRDCGL